MHLLCTIFVTCMSLEHWSGDQIFLTLILEIRLYNRYICCVTCILTPLSLFCQPPLPLVIQSRYQTAFSHRQKLYIQTKLEETRCDSPIIATQNVHLPLAKCCIFLRFSSGRLSLITSQMGHPLPPGTTHPIVPHSSPQGLINKKKGLEGV